MSKLSPWRLIASQGYRRKHFRTRHKTTDLLQEQFWTEFEIGTDGVGGTAQLSLSFIGRKVPDPAYPGGNLLPGARPQLARDTDADEAGWQLAKILHIP